MATCISAGFTSSHDLVARYGSEEFICVLPDIPLEGAEARVNLLLTTITALNIAHEKSEIEGGKITISLISLDVATIVPCSGVEPTDLVLHAARMLYQTKEGDRHE